MSVHIPPVELVDIASLRVDQDNPNRMTDRQRRALAENLKRYGFIVPIVANEDGVIADGQQRWEVAQSLGMSHVPCVKLPIKDVDRRILRQVLNKLRGEHLLDLDAKEYLKIIEEGERESLQKLSAISDKEIQRAIIAYQAIPLGDEDFNYAVETDIQLGELYQLGEHRLLCGDATNKDDVEKLLQDEKVDCLFTDPPYGVDYGSKNEFLNLYDKGNRVSLDIVGDKTVPTELLASYLQVVKPYLSEYNSIYQCLSSKALKSSLDAFDENKIYLSTIIIWVKNNIILSRLDYFSQHELILYGWSGKHKFYNKHESDVWMIDKPQHSPLHSVMKPLVLIEKALNNSTLENMVVYDPFGGSGSSLIACEHLKRKCRMMEIEPVYCQTIINRWEHHTGQKAVKLS